MILGRFLGVLLSNLLVLLLSSWILKEWFIGFIAIILLATLGTALGMGISMVIGPMTKRGPMPIQQDQLEYWTLKYGDELGLDAYKIWLDEV